jgi:predicted ATPase/DNA-binding CsgD family transcriptional regulator
MAATVIGRDGELASVEAFLAEVRQRPAALVLSGEAGIGKTVLWQAGVDEAEQRVGRVLSHQSVEAEALLSFAGLSDLLAPVFEEVAPVLAPLRRRALEVALLLAEPGEEPPDPRLIGLALLDVLRALADASPVVIALDDVQWLDASSAGVLQIALRRLREERVGLLATLRKVPETAAPFELERSFPEERLERIWLGPLNLSALHHLLKQRLGLELSRPELGRVLETSAGNPFFALELGRELQRTHERTAAGQALRVPESLRELLGGRLARLPTETIDVLLHAAALARPTVELVAAAHSDRARVAAALSEAVREGVVEVDDSRVRFANPLLASICYEHASLARRRAVHLALAGAVTDLEERARHLALAAEGPDAAVASELDAAAEQAAARGATAAAAELCELAAELTPTDPALARQRRFRAARFHRLAGDGERAVAILAQLRTEVPAGVERADVLFALASTWRSDRATLTQLCDEALAEAVGDDARSARILAWRGWLAGALGGDARSALADARAALEKAERADDRTLLAVVIAQLGAAETWAAEITPGLLERGVEIEERLQAPLGFHESPRIVLARRLIRLGDLNRSQSILEQAEEEASARGDEHTRMDILYTLSFAEWHAGHWQRALDHATAATELADQIQVMQSQALAGRNKALVEADLGLVEQARASATKALASSHAMGSDSFAVLSLGVLGRIELALGDLEAAGGLLRELPGRVLALGYHDPVQPVWTDAIETLIALGELEQAHMYLEPYGVNARRIGSPWAVAAAERCRGLLAAADGDLSGAFDAFERALAELEANVYPFEQGRTLLCLGSALRRGKQKRAARHALEQALAIFDELGARLWAEKARAELKRISGRRPASNGLTETERQVAELAARGRSNQEIASALFIGVSTVERHLSQVYRKLGVRRAELAGQLAKSMDEATQT